MWKKIAPLLLVMAMILSLAACGKQEEQTQLQRGTVEGNTYSSDSLNVVLPLNDTWEIADEEQIAEMSGMVADTFDNEEIKERLENGSVVYDFYALRYDGASLNITIQKLNLIGSALVTEDSYADTNLKQLPETLAAAGIKVDGIEKDTVEFAGQEHVALKLSGEVQEVPLHETMVLVKSGSYIFLITAATFYEDTTADLLALFQAR
jgi:hypothetical protein